MKKIDTSYTLEFTSYEVERLREALEDYYLQEKGKENVSPDHYCKVNVIRKLRNDIGALGGHFYMGEDA